MHSSFAFQPSIPFSATNNRDNINAKLVPFSINTRSQYVWIPICVFFAQCTQIREFRPGFRPMKFHLEFQYAAPYIVAAQLWKRLERCPLLLWGFDFLSLYLYTPLCPPGSWVCGPIIERMIRKHHEEILDRSFCGNKIWPLAGDALLAPSNKWSKRVITAFDDCCVIPLVIPRLTFVSIRFFAFFLHKFEGVISFHVNFDRRRRM